jgi:hypothetical protein
MPYISYFMAGGFAKLKLTPTSSSSSRLPMLAFPFSTVEEGEVAR